MAKTCVIFVHGGSCWTSYAEYLEDLKQTKFSPDFTPRRPWQESLAEKLGSKFKVMLLEMPNWQNAKYLEWKIWFEKALAVSSNPPVVVGHSLGGIFLIKYFSESVRPKKITGMFLVGTPYRTFAGDPDFGDFALKEPPHRLQGLGTKVHFYHSQDDPYVAYADVKKYRRALPDAVVKTFKTRGHFTGDNLPEICEDIRSIRRSVRGG